MNELKSIKIILADQEEEYVSKFKKYLDLKKERNRIELISATTKDSLQNLVKSENFDLLLATPYFFDTPLVHEIPIVVGLDDQTKKEGVPFPLIEKYQSLSKLTSELLAIYFEKIEHTEYFVINKGVTKIISVFSSTSGAGKTVFALNLANELTKMELKVLYLNLETIHSTELFLKDNKDARQSSEIIYFAQKKSDRLLSKIEKYKKTDSYLGFDYFDFIHNPAEMLELKRTEVQYLLNIIKSSDVYDYVVVDLDSQLHERSFEAIQASQKIIWLVKNDATSIFKSEIMGKNSRALIGLDSEANSAVHFIMNQCQEDMHLETSLPIKSRVPYISSWHNLQETTDIFDESEYSQAITKIMMDELLNLGEKSNG